MAFGKAHTRGHIVAEINVTPLTDVFLVLLIIFMITTSAMMKPADVDLPKTAEQEEQTKGVMVTITPLLRSARSGASSFAEMRTYSNTGAAVPPGGTVMARAPSNSYGTSTPCTLRPSVRK